MEIKNYFNEIKKILDDINTLEIGNVINDILYTYENGKTIFLIGNGGSAAKASHFAQDLLKGVFIGVNDKRRIKAISLCDNIPVLTALSNDINYDIIFSEQLKYLANSGDLLIAISGSGNSKNILEAAKYAKANNIKVIGLTGFNGGLLKSLSDTSLHIEKNNMGMVEAIHSVVIHYIVEKLNTIIKKENG